MVEPGAVRRRVLAELARNGIRLKGEELMRFRRRNGAASDARAEEGETMSNGEAATATLGVADLPPQLPPPVYQMPPAPIPVLPTPPTYLISTAPLAPATDARASRSWKFWLPLSLLLAFVLAGASVGSFMAGRETRMSDGQVADRIFERAAAEEARFEEERVDALTAQQAKLQATFSTKLENARAKARANGYKKGFIAGKKKGAEVGYSAGRSAGFAAGESTGYSSGYSSGSVDGYVDGFGVGTCYDPYDYSYVC